MKKIILLPLLVLTLFVLPAHSQINKLIRRASVATSIMDYDAAISYYNQALAIDANSYRANIGKGMVLAEFMQHYDEAIPFLEKALVLSPKDTLLRMNNTLGKSYQYVGNYERALHYYDVIHRHGKKGNPDYDAVLTLRIANCKYALSHTTVAPASEQWVKNIGAPINSEMPEYGAVIVGEDLIFTSKRKDEPNEKKNGLDGKYFESMYKTTLVNGEYTEPTRYTLPFMGENSKYTSHNEAVVSVSPDGKILYIFRDGKIFESQVEDNTKDADKLNKNVNIARFQNHASLSPDGTVMYFTSKPKALVGGTDIYTSVKGANGKWSTPEMLDYTINTEFDEDAPFLDSDGTLYFSSNGLPGYGGFDVYKTHLENGHWTTPENLGQPINSPGDDIYFTLGNNSSDGFYSSARFGGKGDIDIYRVHYNVKRDTLVPEIPLAVIIIPQKETDVPLQLIPMHLEEMNPPVPPSQLPKKLDWNPAIVYFEFDKAFLDKNNLAILDNNIAELNKNIHFTFSINGYADARGTNAYNQNLSAHRAAFVKHYLIEKGIDKNRITSTNAFGETVPVNSCTNDIVCTEDEHLMNRRVQLSIINRDKISKPLLGITQK